MQMKKQHKLLIIGSGPAAYTAALYAGRAMIEPLIIEGMHSGGIPGGQLMTTTEVENFPGFPKGIQGHELVELFREQALRFGASSLREDVTSVALNRPPFEVATSSERFLTDSLIIATGAYAKRLDVPGTRDNEFWQKGVTSCAVCDGAMPIFRGKPLFVIGGGDSAIEEALFLTRFGSRIFIVHRRDQFRASKIMSQRALSHPKIEVLWDSVLVCVEGEKVVLRVVIENLKNKNQQTHQAAGVFFAIGHQPNTFFLQNSLKLNPGGYIEVVPGTTKTSVEGVFAAGDVQDPFYRQAVTAAGSGCMAALDAERWLQQAGI